MQTSVSYTRLRSAIRQRNVLATAASVLTLTVLMQAFMIHSRETRVILTPTLHAETALSSGAPGADYLEQVTRDVAGLFLNRHPHNLGYFRENILRLAHPSTHGSIEAALLETERRLIATKTSTVFYPAEIFVDPESLYSEIRGEVHTYLGPDRVETERAVYAADWRFDAMRLWLEDFYPITPEEAQAIDAPLSKASAGDVR
ncbi:type IV conjugative transfer system protein TraE [Parvularcula oceani]|uniref:type IV conjugative transfer system protein TraE n=1 Tax=Parvularcula oceani TaxID=1247963 RepID=UPI0004E20F50|nr:type IV conjugative transfer system protein TraE [Parvularcula oceani]